MTAAEKIKEMGIVPVVVLEDEKDAGALAKALCEGGLPCAEVTFRTAAAKESIRIMLKEYPEMFVGAGTVLTTRQVDEAIEAANEIASEHMEIVTKNAFEVMMKVRNAGAIFIGEYSSEPLGDYFAGPNHVLPTNGTAKFFSALSVDDFIKKSSIVYYSRSALQEIHKDIIQFASSEQLTAHANSIAVRFEEEDKKEQP